jgi:phosphopantothenoylcysteine decarboxylase / phosphopantothenate---cysteine ligase
VGSLRGLRVLITSGPTREYLDPIRFLTNASSGRMGAALARAALRRGASVTVVSGPSETPLPAKASVVSVTTAREMLRAALKHSRGARVVVAAAAGSVWRAAAPSRRKIKRSSSALRLTLKPNPDIIKTVARRRRPGQILIGFALETHDTLEHAAAKMKAKGLDMIVANGPRALGAEKSSATLLLRGGWKRALSPRSKDALASAIFDAVEDLR